MLAKKYRLSKKKDFQNIFKRGKSFKEGCIFLKAAANNIRFSRFGFVVSNKISKKSVERHKIKRRLNEIIRFKMPLIRKGYDMVIIAGPEIKNKDYRELEEIIKKLLITAKLLNP
ncbi:MAG: ribonuclease P protein component [Parcubacteria group bacterium CG11_big_fil_rev_8_21_14_0_20_39_14]|nr:MAG: ribonuclease P protein component [Parcubacteria group bacterium CG11_big_fil_rev_8_21_14_0_20_39_14]PIS35529.1 MAG: ribonuclease P protein component [Parcubacteria group bacterium CG08_land_8_20_14_0_20_38_56]